MKKTLFILILLFVSFSGFCQSYFGTVVKQVNFRNGPGTDSQIISSLKKGTQVFIVSIATENDFYNIIDITTNTEGYVHKSFILVGKVVPKDKDAFSKKGLISDEDSLVEIFNETSLKLTIKMNSEYYYFNPHETRKINFEPGLYNCRASVPGVIPYLAEESLKGHEGYSWKFYITKR